MPMHLPSQAPITFNFYEKLENKRVTMKYFACEEHASE